MSNVVEVAPYTARVYLVYKCPSCGADHTLKREETEYPGAVLCPCGQRIRVRQVHKIHVKPLYREICGKNFFSEQTASDEIRKDAVSALVGLGHKKSKIKPIISCLTANNSYNDVSELLRDFFKLEREKNNGK